MTTPWVLTICPDNGVVAPVPWIAAIDVTWDGTSETVTEKVVWPVRASASVAVAVTLDVPTAVGVPDTAPVLESRLKPSGRPVADHV